MEVLKSNVCYLALIWNLIFLCFVDKPSSSLASDQDMMDGTASNESRYSLAAGGVSHVATAGLSAPNEATSAAMSMSNQQAMTQQQNQILQMIKNHLSMSSNSLPPHQQMVDGGSGHASRGYVPSMGFPAQQQFLNYPTGSQMVGSGVDQLASARWPAAGNRHALDIMAQLRSQGQGQVKTTAAPASSGYLPYRPLTGASSSQQQHSMLAPADMAAILLQRLQNSSGQPMPGAKPQTNLPIGNAAPPPIGRAIVKGRQIGFFHIKLTYCIVDKSTKRCLVRQQVAMLLPEPSELVTLF